ncbi:MAG: L,D-transpeptidase family protein [Beijerinckiaceae bacterium]
MASAIACIIAVVVPAAAEEPSFSPTIRDRIATALKNYEELAARGGWKPVPKSVHNIGPGASGEAVQALHMRLLASGDMTVEHAASSEFGEATTTALKKFQARHGLSLTGTVGTLTWRALNVPIDKRLQQLRASQDRLKDVKFNFPPRYVVLNIPAASVEAVQDNKVALRSVAVVGRHDRASPTLQTRMTAVNLNPYWTAPTSIVKADIIPKVQKDVGYLAKHKMRLIGAGNQEIDPATIDWTKPNIAQFFVRQDPGAENSLGAVRIDMPNTHAVYMHDTPKKSLFRSDVRFHSSGCARVLGIRDLAAWLLEGTGIDRLALEADIAAGDNKTIRLPKAVPVIWIYMTAWGNADGGVEFRDDIYKLDEPKPAAQDPMVAQGKPVDTQETTGSVKASAKSAQPTPAKKPAQAKAPRPHAKTITVAKAAAPATMIVAAPDTVPVMPQALAQPVPSHAFGPR